MTPLNNFHRQTSKRQKKSSSAMEEFIGQKVKVAFVQKIGWKEPTELTLDKKIYKVVKIYQRWEEHTKEKYWRDRKHRVWYEIEMDDGAIYQLYWDRGAYGKGKDWVLAKKISRI